MNKSSHTKTRRKQQQAVITALGLSPDVVQEGVNEFIDDFKRVLLEALLQSEVNTVVGIQTVTCFHQADGFNEISSIRGVRFAHSDDSC
ncbi:MAG: hypothetical protein SGJ27_20765 [Candidatus Melainabacteria bacterium]|nr:hypothetical protein [Candidatus Melainabacteria bacterium]